MFEDIKVSDSLTVSGITLRNTRVLFEPCEDIHPDDSSPGLFSSANGALLIDDSKPAFYKKALKQIMAGISDSQRYRNLPMRRISGTDSSNSPYAVVAIGSTDNESFQALADEWAGYYSGHAYNVRVQDFNPQFNIWTYRDSDSVIPFFGDPTIPPHFDRAAVLVASLVKDDNG